MNRRLTHIALAAVFALGASASTAWALPLTYTTVGVVGTYDNGAALDILGNNSTQNETASAQFLLNLAQNTSYDVSSGGTCPAGATSGGDCYKTNEAINYSGTLVYGVKIEPIAGGNNVVSSTYEYALGKYNGPSAGYVLFYLPTFGYTIPLDPANFWTTGTPTYGLSHISLFNRTSVPDGGATLSLLGMGLVGLSYLRRRLN